MDTFDRAQMARRFAEILLGLVNYNPGGKSGMENWAPIAQDAFDLADAMIAEENKRKETK